jgi:hypothetical protein
MHYHDLVAPMVAHCLYDFIALVYLSLRVNREAAVNAAVRRPSDELQVDDSRHEESEN